MDITREYLGQFEKHTTYYTLPSGDKFPKTTIQPGLNVHSRLFLRADNAPEFYVSLSAPIPRETALLVMPDGRAVFVPAARIEETGLDKELPPAGVPLYSTFYPIADMPGERLALTKPIPKGKLLIAGSSGRAVMVELHGGIPNGRIGECKKAAPLIACIVFDPETRDVFVGTPQLETFTREQLLEDLQMQEVRK